VAEYFNVDPVIVRIVAVVLACTGPGVIAYVLAWIFVPAEPGPADHSGTRPLIDTGDRATQIFGIVLLALGVSVFWGDWWNPVRGWLFPLGLIVLGAWLLLRRDDDGEEHAGPPPLPPSPPQPALPPTPPAAPSWGWTPPAGSTVPVSGPAADPLHEASAPPVEGSGSPADEAVDPALVDDDTIATDPGGTDATAALAAPGAPGGISGGPPRAPWDMPPSPAPGPAHGEPLTSRHDHRRRRHPHRHIVGPSVFGVLLVWAGIAWLAGIGLTTGLAVGLVILGLGFVVGSFVGGSRALIFPAIVVAVALILFAAVDIPLSGPVGEQRWSPDSVDELEELYDVSMGEGTLDLTDLEVPSASDVSVAASVGLGHLVVLVAEDEDVFVNTKVGAGEAVVFGVEHNGMSFDTHDDFTDGDGDGLVLDLEVGMGQIEVRRAEANANDTTTTTTTRDLG
jgi:hypothetical protein